MKRLTSFTAACLALLLAAAPAGARAADNLTPAQLGVNAAALSASPSFTVRTGGYHLVTVTVVLTRSAATTLQLRCTVGPNVSVQAPLPVQDVNSSTGQVTLVQAPNLRYAITASGTYRFLLSNVADDLMVCTLSGAGATTNDLVSAYFRGAQ